MNPNANTHHHHPHTLNQHPNQHLNQHPNQAPALQATAANNTQISGGRGPAFIGHTNIGANANFAYNNFVVNLQTQTTPTGQADRRLRRYAEQFGYDPSKENLRVRRNDYVPAEILLHVCVILGDIEVVKLLLARDGDYEVYVDAMFLDGWSPLHVAAMCGHADAAAALGRLNANPNLPATYRNWSALHCAAFKGNAEAARAIANIKGAEVDIRAYDMWTPLHLAASNGYTKTVQVLAGEFHANLNAKDNGGMSPLSLAKAQQKKKVVKILNEIRDHNRSQSNVSIINIFE
ncbi:ankyrin repeat-containing domain protein [Endogone sp. FLAS-F59071]|nr:ankyrin repeat-containing domain protein [Endogone sp. FLAS-F59071]|eukprot:RUS16487.1 ankyrin repeat-containing domain protein [Endogone sp. FLAS-F59071]